MSGKEKLKLVGWSLLFFVGGLVLAQLLAFLFAKVILVPGAGFLSVTAVETSSLLMGYAVMTWLIGVRVLRFTRADLEQLPESRGRRIGRFGWGALLGVGLATVALLVAVPTGHAGWRTTGSTLPAWLARVVLIGAILLPAALAEELAFRGVPILALTKAFGRVPALIALALLFALAHADNPSVTWLALANIAIAGVFLGLVFFTPGGLWTSTGAHLGWNLTLAGLGAPVSGFPMELPWLSYAPGQPSWLTGGSFGPEGGILASICLLGGSVLVAKRLAVTRGVST